MLIEVSTGAEMKDSNAGPGSNPNSRVRTFPLLLANLFYVALDMLLRRKTPNSSLETQDHHDNSNTHSSGQYSFIDRSFYTINNNTNDKIPHHLYHQINSTEANKNRTRRPQRNFYSSNE